MNITSYNITDVSYHYIGLRVLGGMGIGTDRSQQIETISRNVHKFVTDRALRLMLPEPRGTFKSVGEKVCQELVHFGFVNVGPGGRYELSSMGHMVLKLLGDRDYVQLRQKMARVHLKTYDNLRATLHAHVVASAIWQPVVTAAHLEDPVDYLTELLKPTLGTDAAKAVSLDLDLSELPGPKKVEDILRTQVLRHAMPTQKMRVALFRAICDRLVSLRLLNKSRAIRGPCEFDKTYSPCVQENPKQPWYAELNVPLDNGDSYQIYLCEPDAADPDYQSALLAAIDVACSNLRPEGGYYDIPDLRDWVCEYLMIPEAAFDDGLNSLLDLQPPVLSAGLQYDRITSRRRPLVRAHQNVQLHNLVRRV